MSTVLVTRPGQDGEALCLNLQQRQINSLHHPLIKLTQGRDYASLIDDLSRSDIVIAVSQYAVVWSQHTLQLTQQHFPTTPLYFAIGNKTAECLQRYTQSPVISPQISDSEHLLDLPALKLVKNKRILILRGNGGRELIQQTLQQRGAEVYYNEIYRRESLPIDAVNQWKQWKMQAVSHLVITSGEQLAFFMSQVPKQYLPWVIQLKLYVPSLRIQQQAKELGFSHIINTGSAANPVLLDCLSKTFTTGQKHDR
ncbi:MAG TPA: uroporphyrinogen-III synthase [Vibrio sp.]|uniref:uroporphyrinogen-III synthase n=1 Tax=Vibrio sp. TaxID=678 RepID=UPI000ED0ADD6|nr:uroporphyrinogen-III synthase [Vibrio sp.]HCH00465.1 uroporphyrinogen-III synthase [Vibrio sp.]